MFDVKKIKPSEGGYHIEREFIRLNYPKLLDSYKEGEGGSESLNELFLEAIWLQEFDNKKDFLLQCTDLKKVGADLSLNQKRILIIRDEILGRNDSAGIFKLELDGVLNPIYDECKQKKISFLEKNANEEFRKIHSKFKKAIEELEDDKRIPSTLKKCKVNQVIKDVDYLVLRACFKKRTELNNQVSNLSSGLSFYLKIFSLVSLRDREIYMEKNYRDFLENIRPDNLMFEEENLVKAKNIYSDEITNIIQTINNSIQEQNSKFKEFTTSSTTHSFLDYWNRGIDGFKDLNNLEKFLIDRNAVINKWTKDLRKKKYSEFRETSLELMKISPKCYEELYKNYESSRYELESGLVEIPDEFMRNILQAELYQKLSEIINKQSFEELNQRFNYLKFGQESD